MINIFRGYIHTKDKKPIQKFKGVDNLPTLEDVTNSDEYAGILNDDYLVMDVDDTIESDKVYELVKELDLNCKVVKTTRGKHFIFKKNPKYVLKGTTKNINALGVEFDIRVGINQYIVVKFGGVVREVLRDFDESKELTLFPHYFIPINSTNRFTSMGEDSGRNGKLFGHIATLIRNGFSKEEVLDICKWINDFMFDSPLKESELKSICRDEAFKNLKVFNVEEDFGTRPEFKPSNYSDLAMAELFSKHYIAELRYNKGTDWLVWNGKVWEMSELKAEQKYIKFLKKVLKCAQMEVNNAYDGTGNKQAIDEANKFYRFVLKMQDAGKIASVLKLSRSFMDIDISALDANPFDLNTPIGIVDLKTGSIREHDASSFCTKITKVAPTKEGIKMWQDLLNLVTKDDPEYIEFLQVLCGAIVIGKVYNEALIIAQGSGANGKSTVFNTISKVLGNYAGKIPAESLTTRAKNIKVDLAELFGKRLILASETEEGQRLSNQMLKQIASVDEITGEKKYHDPFVFEPTHTAILYTNFLPRLGSLDNGTKRRIIICPFNAEIKNPQKDFAEKLYQESSGAILDWLIEGAKKFINGSYVLPQCIIANNARTNYFEENDWLSNFINDCCNLGELEKQSGSELYKAYKQWCQDIGEYPKRNRDFANALEMIGLVSKKTNKCFMWIGISLDPDRTIGKTTDSTFL